MTRFSIAHVLNSFGVGGGERVAMDLAVGQQRQGHQVCAISLAPKPDGPMAALFHERGIATHTVAKLGPTVDPTLVPRLIRKFRSERISLVHSHNPQPLVYATLPARLSGARVVHTKHGLNQGSPRLLWLQRQGAKFVDAYVAVSETTAEQALAHSDCNPDKIRVIANGIELEHYNPSEEARRAFYSELGLSLDDAIVGTVGRIHEDKNHGLLVRATAPLLGARRNGPGNVHLVIVGDGPEYEALARQVAALDRASFVHLLGRRMDVPALLPAFSIFAMSSATEGLPLVLPEAMATGLPIVSTDVGGIGGVVHEGETGFLVPAGDETALTARLDELINDDTVRRTMGHRGRKIALEEYSAQRMVADYLHIYDDVLRVSAG